MSLHRPLDCPDPAMSVAMLRMLHAIRSHRPGDDAGKLAFRTTQLVETTRRCLSVGKQRDIHDSLWLASVIEGYERRWNSSAAIGSRFDQFQQDSRRFIGILERRMAESSVPARPDAA